MLSGSLDAIIADFINWEHVESQTLNYYIHAFNRKRTITTQYANSTKQSKYLKFMYRYIHCYQNKNI